MISVITGKATGRELPEVLHFRFRDHDRKYQIPRCLHGVRKLTNGPGRGCHQPNSRRNFQQETSNVSRIRVRTQITFVGGTAGKFTVNVEPHVQSRREPR